MEKRSLHLFTKKIPKREMWILTNQLSQIICSDTQGRFQLIKTECYAPHIRLLIAAFCFDYQNDRGFNCKVADGAQQDTVLYKMQKTPNCLQQDLDFPVPSHFREKELTPLHHRNISMFLLFHLLQTSNTTKFHLYIELDPFKWKFMAHIKERQVTVKCIKFWSNDYMH